MTETNLPLLSIRWHQQPSCHEHKQHDSPKHSQSSEIIIKIRLLPGLNFIIIIFVLFKLQQIYITTLTGIDNIYNKAC